MPRASGSGIKTCMVSCISIVNIISASLRHHSLYCAEAKLIFQKDQPNLILLMLKRSILTVHSSTFVDVSKVKWKNGALNFPTVRHKMAKKQTFPNCKMFFKTALQKSIEKRNVEEKQGASEPFLS